MTEFYIVSIKHTQSNRTRRGRYVSFWRPDDAGYCWPLSWAGRYSEARVRGNLDYYNDGKSTIAVATEIVDALAVPTPRSSDIDGDTGPVVMNTPANWRILRDARIQVEDRIDNTGRCELQEAAQ